MAAPLTRRERRGIWGIGEIPVAARVAVPTSPGLSAADDALRG